MSSENRRPFAGKTLGLAAAVGVAATLGYLSNLGGDPWFFGVLVAAICLAVAAGARRLLLAAAVVSLVLGSVPNADVKDAVFYVRFFFVGAAGAANLWAARGTRPSRATKQFSSALALASIWLLASTLWSVNTTLTLQRALAFALLIFTVTATLSYWRARPDVVRGDIALIGGVIAAVMVASATALLLGAPWASSAGRFRGILENPNSLGIAGGLVLPLSAGFSLRASSRTHRAGWVAVAIMASFLILVSESRSGIIGGILGLVVFFLRSGYLRSPAIRLPVLSVVSVILVALSLDAVRAEWLGTTLEYLARRGASGRLYAWQVAWNLVLERPFEGWGFGTTEEVFGRRVWSLQTHFQGELVHNGYLQLLLEVGPVGLALIVSAVLVALRAGALGRGEPVRNAISGSFCAGAVIQLAESGIVSPGSLFALNFWLLGAAIVALAFREPNDFAAMASDDSLVSREDTAAEPRAWI